MVLRGSQTAVASFFCFDRQWDYTDVGRSGLTKQSRFSVPVIRLRAAAGALVINQAIIA
jgi:hypothetical protein